VKHVNDVLILQKNTCMNQLHLEQISEELHIAYLRSTSSKT